MSSDLQTSTLALKLQKQAPLLPKEYVRRTRGLRNIKRVHMVTPQGIVRTVFMYAKKPAAEAKK